MALREARPFLIGAAALLGASLWLAWWIPAAFSFLLLIGLLLFFRDPERTPPADPLALVSPADGKVICVDEAEDPCFGQGKFRRVGIFLSVLDVHVNRSPYAGTFEKTHYSAGEFLDARHLEVDLRNENQTWLLKTSRGTVLVRQIAGLIARRIVGWKKPGDSVQTGERFGMIRFGSRTDLYFPASCTPKVQPGQRVVGGETVIATWPA
ncbi:MAG: phosphatidylserine decarboxylase [Verrucomicrobia bacterium]|jgi:phosphatidylserine decarboxylase|nr:phosphatidylserine decarboxylase [Verrucomicrobiota bacterium]NBS83503.1 phosphatidylserine decarboxylase [Verrucomicrobiota bacterium]